MHTARITNRSASLFLLPALALLAAGCADDPAPPPTADARPAVRVAVVQSAASERTVRMSGVLRPERRTRLAFLQTGYLVERRVEPGDRVAAGTPLAVVENAALEPAVAAARARVAELETRLAQLQRDAERLRQLRDRDLVAADALESAEAERDAAARSLDQARAERDRAAGQLSEARLIAPFDGVIGQVLAEPGDRVVAGQPVVTLLGEGPLELELRLPETMVPALSPGTPVTVTGVLDAGSGAAVLRHLGRSGDDGSGTPAILEITEPTPFRSGQAVHAHVPVKVGAGLRVPVPAVMDAGGRQPMVWVVGGQDRVRRVPVRAVRMDGHAVSVSGALTAGDRVVVAGQRDLAEGMQVRVLP